MKEGQCIQSGRQHILHFVRGKGTMQQDLRESLIGILHHHEDKLAAPKLAQAGIE